MLQSKYSPYRASKWLSVPILVEESEMRSLFATLGNFLIFSVGRLVRNGQGMISHETFLAGYRLYVECLKAGKLPDESIYRQLFGAIFTATANYVEAMQVKAEEQLIRVLKPVIQLQYHTLDYSSADHKFRSMVFGQESVVWGIQFSYPQLFEDPLTSEAHKVDVSPQFLNTALFRQLQSWVRQKTIPTPFVLNGKIVNVPMRLGKECLPWINRHPQLKAKGLSVQD